MTILLSPIAFILNFIPVVCFLDAAAVFAACLKLTCFDIEQYKCYLKNIDSLIQKNFDKEMIALLCPFLFLIRVENCILGAS